MDFQVFTKTEIEELCQTTLERMPEQMRNSIIQEFGGIEQWRSHYVERCSKEDMQKGYQKMVEWYGDKDRALSAMTNPPSKEVGDAFAKRIEAIEKKLCERKECPADSFEVKQLVGEYGFVMKQFIQVKHEEGIMRSVADNYRFERSRKLLDSKYGDGAAEFLACAIETFYGKDGTANDETTSNQA